MAKVKVLAVVGVMKRRQLLLTLLSALGLRAQQPKLKKYYITTGRYDCHIPPIESWGENPLDALVRVGMTVWSEEEWLAGQRKLPAEQYRKMCAEAGSTLEEAIEESRRRDEARKPR